MDITNSEKIYTSQKNDSHSYIPATIAIFSLKGLKHQAAQKVTCHHYIISGDQRTSSSLIWMISLLVTGRHFSPSCSEVNSKGYS